MNVKREVQIVFILLFSIFVLTACSSSFHSSPLGSSSFVGKAYTAALTIASPCIDSDNGLNLFSAGEVVQNGDNRKDFCDTQGILHEYTCDNNKITEVINSCPKEFLCKNNACQSSVELCNGIDDNRDGKIDIAFIAGTQVDVCVSNINCGSFGNACPKKSTCVSSLEKNKIHSSCTCEINYKTCRSSVPCSIDLSSDIHNCGACDNSCLSNEKCVKGICTERCIDPDNSYVPFFSANTTGFNELSLFNKTIVLGKDPYGKSQDSARDSCSSQARVVEVYCDNETHYSWNGYDCPKGMICDDGACKVNLKKESSSSTSLSKTKNISADSLLNVEETNSLKKESAQEISPSEKAKKFNEKNDLAIKMINVLDFGAKGDGLTNDAAAIQQALDLAAKTIGKVYVPKGVYLLEKTLIIGDHTEFYGEYNKSILKRLNKKSNRPLFGGENNCEKNLNFAGMEALSNAKYNCGNTDIYIHDLVFDGSLVTTTPGSVTIALSAVDHSIIKRIIIKNAPQDGIFIRNGGIENVVSDNLIDGFNMQWYNGGGIIVEMHKAGNTQGQLRIENNELIVKAPDYCGSDTSCATNVNGIVLTWISGENAPSAIIRNNHFKLTNLHQGIACNMCKDSLIINNTFEPLLEEGLKGGLYTGIVSESAKDKSGRNISVVDNVILGNNRKNDGRGIMLSNNNEDAKDVFIIRNVIKNKNLNSNLAGIEVRGYSQFRIENNTLENIQGGHGIVVGNCAFRQTGAGVVFGNNVFFNKDEKVYKPLVVRRGEKITFKNNVLFPVGEPLVVC